MDKPAVDVGSLEDPRSTRRFLDGSVRSEVRVGPVVVGRGVYRPGWRWSEHAGAQTEKKSQSHAGYVVAGRMAVLGADGAEVEVGPGEAFFAAPGHDAWVLGEEPCVALDFGPQ